MAFTVARALQTGGLGLADFADDTLLADPVIRPGLSDATTVVGTDRPTGGPDLAAALRASRRHNDRRGRSTPGW